MTYIIKKLFELKDESYKSFHAKLVPGLPPARIIGVRTPALRAFAKEFVKTGDTAAFMNSLPHYYYEENNLHAMCIAHLKSFDEQLKRIEELLPYVDNWATCDTLAPKSFKKHPDEVYAKVKEWISSEKTYTVRFALVVLLQFFLDEHFTEESLRLAARVKSSDYYIMMAQAWYLSFALIKQYESALPYFTERRLDAAVHNKAIQKATESFRIDAATKIFLKTLKI